MRVQGWDPVLIISQILCLQAFHYLTMTIIVPPLLSLTNPSLLEYSGGARTVAHILDWREMAARPAVPREGAWSRIRGAWAGGKKVGHSDDKDGPHGHETGGEDPHAHEYPHATVVGLEDEEAWDYGVDDARGWLIGGAWIAATAADVIPLYYLIRRPTYILDFSLTLNLNHLILTTYYAQSFPTSFFFWVVQALGAILMIVVGEQLCVKREMSSELDVWNANDEEVIELNDR